MSKVVYLQAVTPTLPPGYVHTGTDWQIATDANFVSVVFATYNDTENLTEITRVVNEPGPFYARAAFRYDTRVTEWSTAVNCTVA